MYQIPELTDRGTVTATTLTLSSGVSHEAGIPTKFRSDTSGEDLTTDTAAADETAGEGN